MSGSTWKGVERRICRYLGMDRTPLSGGNGKITRADCRICGPESPTNLFVEVKHGAHAERMSRLWRQALPLFESTEQLAAAENKRAVVVLHPKHLADVGQYPTYLRLHLGGGVEVVVQVPLAVARSLLTGHNHETNGKPRTEATMPPVRRGAERIQLSTASTGDPRDATTGT